jgi:tetratricopeptide (TPR) repeat protein
MTELERLHAEESDLRGEGRYEEALAVLERMLAIDPHHAYALNNKGAMLNLLHRYAEALPVLEAAVAADPTNAVAFNNLGWALHNHGRRAEALEQFQTAWDGGYNHPGVLDNAGRSQLALGHVPEALGLWSDSLRLDPAQAELRSVMETFGRLFGVASDRLLDDLPTAAAEQLEASEVIDTDPPSGEFTLRMKVGGDWYLMQNG